MKIKMLVKRVEWISVEVSNECGYDVPFSDDTLAAKFAFIASVKEDYEHISSEDMAARAEAKVETYLESFKIEE